MCYNQTGDISTLDGTPLKLVDKFTYLGSSVSSTEKDIDTRLTKAWTAINRLSIIWRSDLTDKMKRSFFKAAVASILLYGCTTWTLTKRLMSIVFANGLRDRDSVLGRAIPKTQKMVLDAAFLNTKHSKVRIKGKVEQSMEWSSALLYTSLQLLMKKKPSGHPRPRSPAFL